MCYIIGKDSVLTISVDLQNKKLVTYSKYIVQG